MKLWLVEESPCLLTEPYQKEHKGDFRENANNCSQRRPRREAKDGRGHGNGYLKVIASSDYRCWCRILVGEADRLGDQVSKSENQKDITEYTNSNHAHNRWNLCDYISLQTEQNDQGDKKGNYGNCALDFFAGSFPIVFRYLILL